MESSEKNRRKKDLRKMAGKHENSKKASRGKALTYESRSKEKREWEIIIGWRNNSWELVHLD